MNQVAPGQFGSATRSHRRIGDIEMLRGVAVGMVLVEHLPFNLITWPSHFVMFTQHYFRGWTGVDLFLVISGFVIGRNLLPMTRFEGGRDAFVNAILAFWTRRAWRLLPSAWLWLLLPFVASFAFNRSGAFGPTSANFQDAVAAVLDVANFEQGQNYGKLPHTTLFTYWSLSLEEQFYLALPLLIFVLRRHLPWLLAALVVLQFTSPMGSAVVSMTRTGALAFGVLLAIWSETESYRLAEPRPLGKGLTGLVVLTAGTAILGALGSEELAIVDFRLGPVAAVAAILVWVASYDRDYLWPPGWPKRAMLWLGSRSYGIYLIHAPAFAAAREIWVRLSPKHTVIDGSFEVRFVLTSAVLILLLSELNHRFVEQPLRRRGAAIAARLAQRTA